MKKLLKILGGIFGLLLLAALIVPFVVDVDKYRPTIISKANEKLNGKLELGKLGLSLWGQVKINIDGLKLSDEKGRTVVAVKDASFNVSLLSVLTGHPTVAIKMNNPDIQVVKQKDGKLNTTALMKETASGASAGNAAPSASGAKSSSGTGTEVPAMVMNSRFTVHLNHAALTYKDEITGDVYKLGDLNFRLEDVSPSSNMPFELAANLDMLMQHRIKVTGPVVLNGNVKATSNNGNFDKADVKATLSLDGAEIDDPGVFHKNKGVTLGADLVANVGKAQFSAPTLKFKLADVTIDGSASGKTYGEVTSIEFKAHSNRIDVAKLGDLSPLIKEYGMNGLVELSVTANGPTNKLGYGANLKFNDVTLNHESMKQPLKMNGSASLATNQLQDLTVKLTANDFDLNLNGNMQNFLAPRFKFNLTSNNMDLDQLLKSSEKAAVARQEHAKAASNASNPDSAQSNSHAQVVDYNAMFKPLRENPIAAAAAGTFDFNLKRIKSTGVVINDMKGELALNNLLLALKGFSLKIFDGTVSGGMTFNARSAKPEVATNIQLAGLQTQKMVESQMPIARNSVKGTISANLNIGGPGLNQTDIDTAWKGNGTLNIKDAVFSTLDIGKQIKEGVVGKLPEPIRSKVRIPDSLLNWNGEYQNIGMKFGLLNGVMTINDIDGKAYPNKGLDMKGGGNVRLPSYALDMTVDLVDTYNLMNLDKDASDKRFGHFALEPKVGNTLFAPRFEWGATIGKLAQNVATSQAKQLLKDKLPGGLGNILNGGNKDSGGNNQPAQKPADAVRGALKGLFGR